MVECYHVREISKRPPLSVSLDDDIVIFRCIVCPGSIMVICKGSNFKGNQRNLNHPDVLRELLNQRNITFEPNLRYQINDDDDGPSTANGSSETPRAMASDNQICITKNSAMSIFPSAKESAPAYLLVESLIYASCERVEPDPEKCKRLFVAICEYLEKGNFLGKSYQIDALHRQRQFLGSKFDILLHNLKCKVSGCPALPSTEEPKISSSHHRLLNSGAPFNVPIEPDRWLHEFMDKKIIEKGGFGVVHKARHYLDNVFYAVKEITFRFKTPQDFLRIIREVQLYANLPSHPHVVSYKTAWIDNKFVELKRSSLRTKRCSESDKEELLKVPNLQDFDLSGVKEDDEGSSIQFKDVSDEAVEERITVVEDVVDGNMQSSNVKSRRRRHSVEDYEHQSC